MTLSHRREYREKGIYEVVRHVQTAFLLGARVSGMAQTNFAKLKARVGFTGDCEATFVCTLLSNTAGLLLSSSNLSLDDTIYLSL